jgi:hypothetical protein
MKLTLPLFLALGLALGLCSCANTSPKEAEKPVEKQVGKPGAEEFVFIASVHNTPLAGEPQPNAWFHVYKLLEKAGIQTIMTASRGVAAISVERSNSAEALALIRKDAAAQRYWLEIANEFR